MSDVISLLRATARRLLESGEVACFIGYTCGNNPYRAIPYFATSPKDAENLVWNPLCQVPLAKYLLEADTIQGKVGIAVKGCDSRAVWRMVNDHQLNRDRVIMVALPCAGTVDPTSLPIQTRGTQISARWDADALHLQARGKTFTIPREMAIQSRCIACNDSRALQADITLGNDEEAEHSAVGNDASESVSEEASPSSRFADVAKIEALSPAERRRFWLDHFARCIRCYACRNVCPACSCRQCFADSTETRWVSKSTGALENELYHITRAFHVAGRCTGCGECERVCPVGIPLGLLNKKVAKDLTNLFGPTDASQLLGKVVPLQTYSVDDPEEFM